MEQNNKDNLEAKKRTLSKRDAREQAFLLTFERAFSKDDDIKEIIETAKIARELEIDDFAKKLFCGVDANINKIDEIIQRNLKKWTINRISRISITIIRIATYEMAVEKITPVNVAINEAVILAKKYGAEKDSAFVNGVLAGISKDKEVIKEVHK